MPTRNTTDFKGYCRTCSGKDAAPALDRQAAALRAALPPNTTLTEVVFDTGSSFRNGPRPELLRLAAEGVAGQTAGLIVTGLERISRRSGDAIAICEQLRSAGAVVIFAESGLSTDSPSWPGFAALVLAREDSLRIAHSKRTKAGIARRNAKSTTASSTAA